MKVKHYCGYDPIITYTESEIIKMYLSEGMPLAEARVKAKIVKKAIDRLNRIEIESLNLIRRHELLSDNKIESEDEEEHGVGVS